MNFLENNYIDFLNEEVRRINVHNNFINIIENYNKSKLDSKPYYFNRILDLINFTNTIQKNYTTFAEYKRILKINKFLSNEF